jgi:hypothetical protein
MVACRSFAGWFATNRRSRPVSLWPTPRLPTLQTHAGGPQKGDPRQACGLAWGWLLHRSACRRLPLHGVQAIPCYHHSRFLRPCSVDDLVRRAVLLAGFMSATFIYVAIRGAWRWLNEKDKEIKTDGTKLWVLIIEAIVGLIVMWFFASAATRFIS